MNRPLVQLTPLVVTGNARIEVGLFCSWASAWQAAHPDQILDLFIIPEKYTPAPVARNRAVKRAREQRADILCMVDDDMAPPPQFFEAAVQFLKGCETPSVIAVPYCTAPPAEEVLAFEWVSAESRTQDVRWKLERIRREDAARRHGIGRVANLGTGCVFFDMRVFDKIHQPYFDYGYKDPEHTEVNETEDCYCFRHLSAAGVPLYCHWDFWAGHSKGKMVGKPIPVDQHAIDRFYVEQARANLLHEAQKLPERWERAEPPPPHLQDLPEGIEPAQPPERNGVHASA